MYIYIYNINNYELKTHQLKTLHFAAQRQACGQAGDADLAERMARRLLRNRLTPDVARPLRPRTFRVWNGKNHGKTVGKPWKNAKNHRKTIDKWVKDRKNHGKTIGKS